MSEKAMQDLERNIRNGLRRQIELLPRPAALTPPDASERLRLHDIEAILQRAIDELGGDEPLGTDTESVALELRDAGWDAEAFAGDA